MLRVDVDVQPIIAAFEAIGRPDQQAFAVSRGLNKLADRAQQRVRERIEANFKLKRKSFLFNSVKISKVSRATKSSWAVTIEVTYQALADMETGKAHTPGNGRSLLATQAGKLADKIIRGSNALAMRNLNFGSGTIQPHQTGGNRTFSIQTKGGLMIMQRTGKRGAVKAIYRMVSKITRPVKLHFKDTVASTVNAEYEAVFAEAIREVIKSMRPRK